MLVAELDGGLSGIKISNKKGGHIDGDLRDQRIGSALPGNNGSIGDREKHRTNGGRSNSENIYPNDEEDGFPRRMKRYKTTMHAAIARLKEAGDVGTNIRGY